MDKPQDMDKECKIPVTRIEEWISSQGYSFEMVVQERFTKSKFYAVLSNYFLDYESGKNREIDVTAFTQSKPRELYGMRVSICVECKYTKTKPWVIFSGLEENHPAYNLNACLHSKVTSALFDEIVEGEIYSNSLLNCKYEGHSIVQTLRKGNEEDLAYNSCMSAFKASVGMVLRSNSDKPRIKVRGHVSIPVVVIDGQLFECHLGDDGRPSVTEIVSGVVRWKYSSPVAGHPLIYVVTKDGLEQFCSDLRDFCDDLFNERDKHSEKLNGMAAEMVSKFNMGEFEAALDGEVPSL